MKSMKSGTEHHDVSGKHQRGRRLAQIALLGILAFSSIGEKTIASIKNNINIHIKKSDIIHPKNSSFILNKHIDTKDNDVSLEKKSERSIIFGAGIRKVLSPLKKLTDMPSAGLPVTYYRTDGKFKGKPIVGEALRIMGYPDTIGITPLSIDPKNPVSFVEIRLGNRRFRLHIRGGFSITAIYFTTTDLVFETTLKDKKYDREGKLIELLEQIMDTPRGKGEKEGFNRFTIITEI